MALRLVVPDLAPNFLQKLPLAEKELKLRYIDVHNVQKLINVLTFSTHTCALLKGCNLR